MKKLILILLALMLILTACDGAKAEKPTETQASTYSNEGPEGILDENMPTTVYKLMRVVSYNEEGVEQWHREFVYDANGFCVEEMEVTNAGTISYRNVNVPNDRGLTETTQITEANGLQYLIEYTYDEAGRVSSQSKYMDDVEVDSTRYTYDDHGNYLTLQQYYNGELVIEYAFEYTYNDQGKQLTRDEYMNGELLSHVEMEYDEQGREIGSRSSSFGGASQSRTVSTWEGLTETREYYGMEMEDAYLVSVISYDDHGNVILEQSQYNGGGFTMLEYTYEPFEVTN